MIHKVAEYWELEITVTTKINDDRVFYCEKEISLNNIY